MKRGFALMFIALLAFGIHSAAASGCYLVEPQMIGVTKYPSTLDGFGQRRVIVDPPGKFEVLVPIDPSMRGVEAFSIIRIELVAESATKASIAWVASRSGSVSLEKRFQVVADERVSYVDMAQELGWEGLPDRIQISFERISGQVSIGNVMFCQTGLASKIRLGIEDFFRTTWLGTKHSNFVVQSIGTTGLTRNGLANLLVATLVVLMSLCFKGSRQRILAAFTILLAVWIIQDASWVKSVYANSSLSVARFWGEPLSVRQSRADYGPLFGFVGRVKDERGTQQKTIIVVQNSLYEDVYVQLRYFGLPLRMDRQDAPAAVGDVFIVPTIDIVSYRPEIEELLVGTKRRIICKALFSGAGFSAFRRTE